jgi:hypothetical protein
MKDETIRTRPESRVLQISKVRVLPKTLDFDDNNKVMIFFNLTKPATVNVKILDLEHNLVRDLVTGRMLSGGEHSFSWNGNNENGNPVGDGVYLYTIEASGEGGVVTYDPYHETYGHYLAIDKFEWDKENSQYSFILPKAAMLRQRVGIKNGPMLKTLFDWQPEQAGRKFYSWDGIDKSGFIHFSEHPDLYFFTSAYSLAINSILVNNSSNEGHGDSTTPISSSGGYIHAHHFKGTCYEPRLQVELLNKYPENERGYPIVSGLVPIRIGIDPNDRHLIAERYEIMLFVDMTFLFEDEDATNPFNYYWDTRGLNVGEHTLTINIMSYQDHVGVETIKVEVISKDE